MLSHARLRAVFATAAVTLAANGAFSGQAAAYSASVRAACSGDYHRFCPSYPVNSPQLRSCMRSAGKRLSPSCIDALVDAGEISSSVKKRR